jgi:hypothetical protein
MAGCGSARAVYQKGKGSKTEARIEPKPEARSQKKRRSQKLEARRKVKIKTRAVG